jgi:hypothetical protein
MKLVFEFSAREATILRRGLGKDYNGIENGAMLNRAAKRALLAAAEAMDVGRMSSSTYVFEMREETREEIEARVFLARLQEVEEQSRLAVTPAKLMSKSNNPVP